MKPVPPESSDPVALLRQQLILAQVRIMELEDVRDGLTPRLAGLEQLLQATQTLADQKIDEAVHLGKVLADLQAHCDNLLRTQQQTGDELAATRAALADSAARITQRDETIVRLGVTLRQLEAELSVIRSSRSWRWTAWLRALGKNSGGGKP